MQLFARRLNVWRSLCYIARRITAPHSRLHIDLPAQGLKYELPTESVFARHLFKYGAYEPAVSNWLIQNAKRIKDGLLIDIGANFGWYSCLLAKLCPEKTILAYEPDPDTFVLLERQKQLNGATLVNPFMLGLGESDGVLKLHRYKASNRGRNSLLPLHDGESVDVKITRLDDHLASLGLSAAAIALIKIDVEGYELFALRGAAEALSRTACMLLEYSPDLMETAGISPCDLLDLLELQGFRCARFSEDAPVQNPFIATTFEELRAAKGQMDLLLTRI